MKSKLAVRIKGAVIMIPLEEIVYMENDSRKIRLYMKEDEIMFYGTFRQVLPELNDHFLHCSRSYIANMDHIRALRKSDHYEILMDDGRCLPLSKKTFHRVKREFNLYLRKYAGNKFRNPR